MKFAGVGMLGPNSTLDTPEAQTLYFEVAQEQLAVVTAIVGASGSAGAVLVAVRSPQGGSPGKAGRPNFRGVVIGCIDAEFAS